MVLFRNHGSFIFIGDAQYWINPFSDNGTNMVIMNGYQLVDRLINAKDLHRVIKSYDDLSNSKSVIES
jgi:2-polyprenyl-6-methoxyphenol hydroxylase-like FAD-dependent oxidoreductase